MKFLNASLRCSPNLVSKLPSTGFANRFVRHLATCYAGTWHSVPLTPSTLQSNATLHYSRESVTDCSPNPQSTSIQRRRRIGRCHEHLHLVPRLRLSLHRPLLPSARDQQSSPLAKLTRPAKVSRFILHPCAIPWHRPRHPQANVMLAASHLSATPHNMTLYLIL